MTEPITADAGTLTEAEQVTISTDPSENSTEQAVNAEQNTATGEPVSTEQAKSDEEQAAEAKAAAEALAAQAQAFVALIGSPKKTDTGIDWAQGVGIMGGEDRDASTGVIPDGVLATLKAEFAKLPAGPARKAVRDWTDGVLDDAMATLDSTTARSIYAIKKGVLTGNTMATPSAAKEPVDPTKDHVARLTAMFMAPYLVKVPEGVASDWGTQVSALADQLNDSARTYAEEMDKREALVAAVSSAETDEAKAAAQAQVDAWKEPESVDPIIVEAFRLARGRGGVAKTRRASTSGSSTPRATAGDGVRRNVANHIVSAFADKPVGTFMKVAEIVNTRSEEYGDVPVSPGAVSVRLFPANGSECTVPGIKGEVRGGIKGGVKVS